MKASPKTLLVDGDMQLYIHSYTHEYKIPWDEETTSAYIDVEGAVQAFDKAIENGMEVTKCRDAVLCFSVPTVDGFRKKIAPFYKIKRTGERPELYYILKKHALESYDCVIKKTLEADDVMGIMSTASPDKYIIYSMDKDLKQIWGFHYNGVKVTYVSRVEADKMFYFQTLMGDMVDGYPGCPGVGKVKAKAIVDGMDIKDPAACWRVVVNAFESREKTEEDALLNARMARILRNEDYDRKKGEVILWTPPKTTQEDN